MTNEHILKIAGTVNIPEGLELDENYSISLHGSIIAITEDSNEDGTHNATYKFRPVNGEILASSGKRIKIKDKRKLSAKLRSRIWLMWKDTDGAMSEEEFYNYAMGIIIQNADNLVELKSLRGIT